MKKVILLPIIFMILASASAFGQNPVPEPDTLPNPVKEGDPAVRALPPRLDYIEDRHRVTPAELPEPVKQELDGNARYSEWQKAVMYHDKNKDEYIVEFNEAGKTTSYRFNKDGKPILED